MRLPRHVVGKPWGRDDLPARFGAPRGERIGEIWFDGTGAAAALLVKYLFTSERLSVQVHPDDAQARERGLAQGKTECWYIVDAEPGARIGVGLRHAVDQATLRAAALDGSIVALLDWRPVARGDFLFVPAGTVHAIGAGITLVEVQQNSDVTYRLYDYGRPRELHLDDGVAVARPEPYPDALHRRAGGDGDVTLIEDAAFTVRLVDRVDAALAAVDRWIVPLAGRATSAADSAEPGDCLFLAAGAPLALDDGATVLIATR